MIFENHPSNHVLDLFKGKEDIELQFSIYEYEPQSIFDRRTIIDIKANEISEEWVNHKISTLKEGEELAFHSLYKKGKTKYHLPMIDFDCDIRNIEYAKSALSKILPNIIYSGLIFYDSGRSLHAYGSCALTNQEWVKYMGRLLLANIPGNPKIVDTRWVGHRLMGGFSSLRWSSNSGMYIKKPTRITHPNKN